MRVCIFAIVGQLKWAVYIKIAVHIQMVYKKTSLYIYWHDSLFRCFSTSFLIIGQKKQVIV